MITLSAEVSPVMLMVLFLGLLDPGVKKEPSVHNSVPVAHIQLRTLKIELERGFSEQQLK